MVSDLPDLFWPEPEIDAAKGIKGRKMRLELQLQKATRCGYSRGQVNQFPDHRPYSSPFRGMANLGKAPQKHHVPQNAKNVIGQCTERQDQGIGGKLSRTQSLQIQIEFDLTVKLLPQAPLFIQGDHLFFVNGKGRPPGLQFQTGPDQRLPLGVRYPLPDPDHQPKPIDLDVVGPSDPLTESRYLLSWLQLRDSALTKGQIAPVTKVRPPRIPFVDEGDLGVSAKLHKGCHAIGSRVGFYQKRFAGNLAGAAQHLRQKADKSILGMLAPFS